MMEWINCRLVYERKRPPLYKRGQRLEVWQRFKEKGDWLGRECNCCHTLRLLLPLSIQGSLC